MWLGLSMTVFAQGHWIVETPDLVKTRAMMEVASEEQVRDMAGLVLPASFSFFEQAEHEVKGGHELWTLSISAPGALAMSVYFDDFHLPSGAELYFRTPEGKFDETWEEGPVNVLENNVHRRWVNGDVPGDEVVMTYRAPIGLTEPAALHVSGIGYMARHVRFPSPWDAEVVRGGSEACQVNVNCPEGDSWECEKSSVVRLQITEGKFIFFCSGAMVNNTARDCRQLLLTSFHCASEVEDDEWAYLRVRFNYQGEACTSTISTLAPIRTGVYRLGDSNDVSFNGNINGSDFLLVEVEDAIPDSWNPFFAGWDATGFNGNEGVSIHHPSGDLKKISTFTNSLTSGSWSSTPGTHWRVSWSSTQTNWGVTEGGSSGSPIFDENHRILGTLTGGSSFCSNPTYPDFYGKMSYHWDGPNPTPTAEKLKALLDPAGTGEERMDGSFRSEGAGGVETCDVYNACEATSLEEIFASGLTVSPNPSSGQVSVRLPEGFALAQVQVFDALGRPLSTQQVSGSQRQLALDLGAWGSGMRYLTLTSQQGFSTTRKLVVNGAK